MTKLVKNILIFLQLVNLILCMEIIKDKSDYMKNQNISRGYVNSTKIYRITRNTESGRGMMDNDYQDVEQAKAQKPWFGYYDFLITEGSYKFWVIFQLFTIALLIYSAFAAIYYSKYTISDYENYEDYFFGRSIRSVPSVPPSESPFLGLPVQTYLKIFDAIYNFRNKYK